MAIRPSDRFIKDLTVLAEIQESQTDAIRISLAVDDGTIHRPEELIAEVAKQVDNEVAEVLVRQLLAFASMKQQMGISPGEMVDLVHAILPTAVPRDRRDTALQGFGVLLKFVGIPSIERTSRAIELSYDCSNVLQQTRILTDVRPLFSADADEIEGAVIGHTLRVRYDSAGVAHELSFALDENDLRALREQCDRALKKGDTARLKLCEESGVPPLKPKGETNVGLG